jgi:hypothetical protein
MSLLTGLYLILVLGCLYAALYTYQSGRGINWTTLIAAGIMAMFALKCP